MAQESFYGGRQGNSCVIVANYPSIEAMTEDFQAGGATVKKVNYGEYVLIDTVNKNDEDNGKLFRRGMDLANEYGGGEYIGQICGPDGKVREIKINNYDPQAEHIGEQTPSEMTSGKNLGASIQYSQTNVKETETGNITEYLIGFKFPYLVQEFEAEQTDAYDVEDLIVDITGSPIEERPFYRKQKLKIPRGIKGDSLSEIYIFPTIVPSGSRYQTELNSEGLPVGNAQQLNNEYGIIRLIDYDPKNSYIAFDYSGGIGYADAHDVDNKQEFHYGCQLINYKTSDEGTKTQIDIGPYRVISNITVSDQGEVTINYTASDFNGENFDKVQIKTIKDIKINTGEIEGSGDQLPYVTYQVKGTDGRPTEEVHQIGNYPINYVMEMAISSSSQFPNDENHLLVQYSDPEKRTSDIMHDGKVGQVDLGNVKGAKGGISIIGRVPYEDSLYRDGPAHQNPIKPEEFKIGCEGWCMIVALTDEDDQVIYAFNYMANKQFKLGDISEDVIDPSLFIAVSPEVIEPTNLRINGVQLNSKIRKTI